MALVTLPLPHELREKIYREFVLTHIIKDKVKKQIQYECIKQWIHRFHRGCRSGEESSKLYDIQYFITLLIADCDFVRCDQKLELTNYKLRGGDGLRFRDTCRWHFMTYLENEITEEQFIKSLIKKSEVFNFYVRYKKGSVEHRDPPLFDVIRTVDTIKGYIIYEKDVSARIASSNLKTFSAFALENHVSYQEYDDKYPFHLGNEELHQQIIQKEAKIGNQMNCVYDF